MKIEKLFTEKNVSIMLEVEELLNKLELDEECSKVLIEEWNNRGFSIDIEQLKVALFVNHFMRDKKFHEIDWLNRLIINIAGKLSLRPAPVLRIPKLVEESSIVQDS